MALETMLTLTMMTMTHPTQLKLLVGVTLWMKIVFLQITIGIQTELMLEVVII